MKTGLLLMKWARSPQNEAKVPFKVDLPLKLRNFVSGKNRKVTDKGCLYEFSLVVACLQNSNFENKACAKEVDNYQNCYKTFLKNRAFHKEEVKQGKLTPGARNLQVGQVNQLLAKRPAV